ncbi:aminoglycoside 6-adenylyltransferase [Enterococcus sp. BWT-B8]|uniref:aminoglycoside 6-adenylyltransferase n=1 Tax=unclassified Enterococcus TaxID=2608891 RepID=UPI001E39692D|nr:MULTISPECIES: aminoglycoside 6-adenylyltransferase [unclassified Enterococcus]MCB5950672.1 aminoglycoside 6-adenylyltransferase [Enterococcus sp. BWT-B8]MCB5955629.1 aminoglycoside 6-adenylyltransferase [Enterococcus sp. CWB-B31]
MGKNELFYDRLIEAFTSVGKVQKDIKAAYVIGSRAKKEQLTDQWSDLDLLIYTEEPEKYLETPKFISQFGTIWSSIKVKTMNDEQKRLTLFDGGYQVDIVVKTNKEYAEQVKSEKVPEMFNQGVQLIVNNAGNGEQLLPNQENQLEKIPLTEENFEQLNQLFWFMTLSISKQLLIEENWAVKAKEQAYKNVTFQMIEWYELSLKDKNVEEKSSGRFINEWTEPSVYKALFNVLGQFGMENNWEALQQSIDLFLNLSEPLQKLTGFIISDDLQLKVTDWIETNKGLKQSESS